MRLTTAGLRPLHVAHDGVVNLPGSYAQTEERAEPLVLVAQTAIIGDDAWDLWLCFLTGTVVCVGLAPADAVGATIAEREMLDAVLCPLGICHLSGVRQRFYSKFLLLACCADSWFPKICVFLAHNLVQRHTTRLTNRRHAYGASVAAHWWTYRKSWYLDPLG